MPFGETASSRKDGFNFSPGLGGEGEGSSFLPTYYLTLLLK